MWLAEDNWCLMNTWTHTANMPETPAGGSFCPFGNGRPAGRQGSAQLASPLPLVPSGHDYPWSWEAREQFSPAFGLGHPLRSRPSATRGDYERGWRTLQRICRDASRTALSCGLSSQFRPVSPGQSHPFRGGEAYGPVRRRCPPVTSAAKGGRLTSRPDRRGGPCRLGTARDRFPSCHASYGLLTSTRRDGWGS
jgi:hypothetical protein